MLYNNIIHGKLTMIYDTASLRVLYGSYANLNQKISREVKKGKLTRIRRGLFSDNVYVDAPVIANACCSPSYLSFEYALSYYDLIPERVTIYTSAIFRSKNYRRFDVAGLGFEYRSIPDSAFPYAVDRRVSESGIHYRIATREKALCDTLYTRKPVRSISDLKILLFEDMRIDEEDFVKLDKELLLFLVGKYHSNTLNTLGRYLKEK